MSLSGLDNKLFINNNNFLNCVEWNDSFHPKGLADFTMFKFEPVIYIAIADYAICSPRSQAGFRN